MVIGRILSPVHSLGPGNRVCLWTKGCEKKCKGCMSPELQSFGGNEISEYVLSKILIEVAKKNECKGITISGGDPFEQPKSLLLLLKLLRSSFCDILVYTGFELEEIQSGKVGKEAKESLQYIDVLIDGKYIEELNFKECVLRGSTNQKIYILNEALTQEYSSYIKQGRLLETFVHNEDIIVTGIINKEATE